MHFQRADQIDDGDQAGDRKRQHAATDIADGDPGDAEQAEEESEKTEISVHWGFTSLVSPASSSAAIKPATGFRRRSSSASSTAWASWQKASSQLPGCVQVVGSSLAPTERVFR